MQNPTIIIQARTGSTRMPKKEILPFYDGKSIIEIIVEKLLATKLPIVLATTQNSADDALVEKVAKYPIPVFRGSEENVLNRFIAAAQQYEANAIVRVCADNPFLDASAILVLAERFAKKPSDYLSFRFSKNRPSIKTHFGFYAEMITLKTLQKVASLTSEKLYIEHVTNYIYGHPEVFDVRFLNAPELIFSRFDIRLTLDTPDDFILHQKIYAEMKVQNPNFGVEEVVDFLDQNPAMLQQMKLEIDKNSK